MTEPTTLEEAMHADGWQPVINLYGDVQYWFHESGAKVDDKTAHEYWDFAQVTPPPF